MSYSPENPDTSLIVPDVANVEWFQVKGLASSSDNRDCPLYANGFQQTYVDIVIRAVNADQEPVALPEAVLNAIKFVTYDSGAELPNHITYSSSRSDLDKRFDVQLTTQEDLQAEPSDDAIRIYFKSTASERIQIAASLTLNGVVYHTRDRLVPPGGRTEAGKSNSSATIVAVRQDYFIPWDGYTKQRGADIGRDRFWNFKFSDPRYRITWGTQIHMLFSSELEAFSTYGYIAYAVGDRRTFRDSYHDHDGTYQYEINRVENSICTGRIFYHSGWNCPVGYWRYYYTYKLLDQNGNSHLIHLEGYNGTVDFRRDPRELRSDSTRQLLPCELTEAININAATLDQVDGVFLTPVPAQQLTTPIGWLRQFRLELASSSDQAYNNGRQQIAVRLTVEPQAGQVITQEQFQSLRLVVQLEGRQYLPLPEVGEEGHWTYAKSRDERFDFHATATDAPELPVEQSAQVRTKVLYIQTEAPGGSSITLRAMVRKDADTVYYTDGSSFDSSLEVHAVRPPIYRFPDDYRWEKTRDEGDSNGGSRFIHEHSLTPRNVGFSYGEFRSTDTKGMIRWQSRDPNQSFASHVGIALPGETEVQYNPDINLGNLPPSEKVTEPKSSTRESAVIVLQGDNRIPYYSGGATHDQPFSVDLYDRQGNLHRLTVRFDDSQDTALKRRTVFSPSTSRGEPHQTDNPAELLGKED